MTLVILKIFVILIAASYLISGEKARQFFYPVDHNQRESVGLTEIKVAELRQHPYNLFKNKREFIKLAEHYIQNQKKYDYNQYKPYNSSKKVVAFNSQYVNTVLNSLNLLQTSQNHSKIINGFTENPAVIENMTSFKDLSPTTEKFKLNEIETTERYPTQTTENYTVTTLNIANNIDLMELTDSTNIATLLPTIEDLTTEGEILNLLPTNLDNEDEIEDTTTERSDLLDITTQNFEESINSLNKAELKNETTFSVEMETSTIEDIQSATSFIIFNLTSTDFSTENLIDIYNTRDNIISITTEPAKVITELCENISSTNYEDVPVTEENLTSFKNEPSESTTSLYEKFTTLSATEYTTTTDTYDSTLSAYFNGSLAPIDITSDSDSDIYTTPLVSNNLAEETTISIVTSSIEIGAEYIRPTTNPMVIESIVDDTYDEFEANVSLNDSSTQIFETITYSPNSERLTDPVIMLGELISESTMDSNYTTVGSITQQIITEFSPMTTESTFSSKFDWKTTQIKTEDTETTTGFPFQGLIAKYSDSLPVNKGTINQIDKALNIENKTKVVSIDITKAMNMATDKTTTNGLDDTIIDNSTTENTLKLKMDETLDMPTSYNSTKAAAKNLTTYDNNMKFDKAQEFSTRIFSDKTPLNGTENLKSKKFRYATDVMPTLGDYDVHHDII